MTTTELTAMAGRPPQQTLVGDLEQRAFRTLLHCMSRPGAVGTLPEGDLSGGGWRSALVLMQCLLDHEVTFCVESDDTSVREQLLRRTGARTAPLDEAGFVLADAAHATAAINGAREGDLEAPERSATVVVQVAEVGRGPLRATLRGPGIATVTYLEVTGLETAALFALRERNAMFPTGIDLVLVDPAGHVVCLPRSTRIELED